MSSPAPATADAVLTFLESIGRRAEAELYLRLFRQIPKQSFALIAPGAPVIRHGAGGFVEQLRFLADLGLRAPIVLGVMDAPSVGTPLIERLLRRFEIAQLPVRTYPHGACLERGVAEDIEAGILPLVLPSALSGETLPERLRAIAGMVSSLDSRKVVLVRRHGGLRVVGEKRRELAARHLLGVEDGMLSLVNLRTDGALLGSEILHRRDADLLAAVKELFGDVGRTTLMVSITSPLDLLRELFTVRGAGTLVKQGSEIQHAQRYDEIDVARLSALIQSSFGVSLSPGYFEASPVDIVFETDYRGAAIVHDSPVAPYLSKFAVEPVAQGEGIGRDLWQALFRAHPRLFWRTRADNPIANFYLGACDGMQRLSDWHVFWRGLAPEQIPEAVRYAREAPDDFCR